VIAVGVAPVALAAGSNPSAKTAAASGTGTLLGGIHNPANGSFPRTTGLFGTTSGWVSRVKNQGGGGAQTLECGSSTGGTCLEATNRSSGFAFQFSSAGATGGTILLKNTSGAPFTTNAKGVATGLNANYLQGQEASAFQLASQPAANATNAGNAEKLGGQPPSAYLTTGQVLFATVNAEHKLESSRGATSIVTPSSGSTYTVVFSSNVSKCSYSASPVGQALTSGQLGVAPTNGNANAVDVILPGAFSGGFDLQVDC
jgi:hypothetical protein